MRANWDIADNLSRYAPKKFVKKIRENLAIAMATEQPAAAVWHMLEMMADRLMRLLPKRVVRRFDRGMLRAAPPQ
jgi:hypothetical protein